MSVFVFVPLKTAACELDMRRKELKMTRLTPHIDILRENEWVGVLVFVLVCVFVSVCACGWAGGLCRCVGMTVCEFMLVS